MPAVAELKTQKTTASVSDVHQRDRGRSEAQGFEGARRDDDESDETKPVMWGPAIIGFGDRDYTGASGKPTKWFEVGFSPRKAALSLYLMGGKDAKLLAKLGPSSTSGTTMAAGCLYIKRLDDVHKPTLQKLIDVSVKRIRAPQMKKGRTGCAPRLPIPLSERYRFAMLSSPSFATMSSPDVAGLTCLSMCEDLAVRRDVEGPAVREPWAISTPYLLAISLVTSLRMG
jgi:hypothetical protein